MNPPSIVPLVPRQIGPLGELVGRGRYDRLTEAARGVRERAGRRTVWHVNSTATGGGVAEMLRALLGYAVDLGMDTRWLVIDGGEDFFALTKRLHNRLHGTPAGRALGRADRELYQEVSARNADALVDLVRPGDLVVLHDPQTAGMAPALAEHGALVVWRCHVGGPPTPVSRAAWEFLRREITAAHMCVFSRAAYRPAYLPRSSSAVITPSIDPFAAKHREMDTPTVTAILRNAGILDGLPTALPGTCAHRDCGTNLCVREADVVADEPPEPGEPVVVQVSRWDRLKDMAGVMRAFADHVVPRGPGYLILAGPQVADVRDDPEGAEVLRECVATWRELPSPARRRVMLAGLPMADPEENAAVVNALQRYATVVAQKSLAEGFGLTVAEAMWKRRPVVGARVGGIADQIADGTGFLVEPNDLAGFGGALRQFLDDPARAAAMGRAARTRVRRRYLADTQLLRWIDLFDRLLP